MHMSPGSSAIPGIRVSRRAALAGLAYVAGFAQAAQAAPTAPIRVASKIDTEGAILGQLIAETLEARGLAVQTRLQLGPTSLVRQALLSGAIDIYPEYTGNGAAFFHRGGEAIWHDPAAAFTAIRGLDAANGLVWLAPAPADNGWGIAIKRDLATANGWRDLNDLAAGLARGVPVLLAASVEFAESQDALPAFEQAYGFRLRQDQLLLLAGGDTAATIRAASEGLSGVNAAMAYGTDGALDALGMRLLADPRRAQIAFQPAPVIRRAVLAANPAIALWLAPVFEALSLEALRGLNRAVSLDGADPETVAHGFLAKLSPA